MSAMEELKAGGAALGIALDETALTQLLDYLALLQKWNKTYNLTAIRDPQAMLVQHLLDSLAVLPHLPQSLHRLADVGSGAGLPGIPLAIARPGLQVTLIESSQKKSAFQQQAKIDLGLNNVSIYSGRVEDYQKDIGFDGVISRAFSDLADFVRLGSPLVGAGGKLYAMKGGYPQAEVAALPDKWRESSRVQLQVPGLEAQRHLLILEGD